MMYTSHEEQLEQFPSQCIHAAKLAKEYYISSPEKIDNIVVCGMGHEALAGDLLKSYYNIERAVYVNRGFEVPAFVNEKTLVFVISHSGDTEEIINCYRHACRKKAQVMCITSGGKLAQLCRMNSTDLLLIPKYVSESLSLGYTFIPLLMVLENAGLITIDTNFKRVAHTLSSPLFKQKGRELAKRLHGKTPLIYTSSKFRSIGLRWCAAFNTVARTHAFTDELPNARHTSLCGFEKMHGSYEAILINGEDDYSKIKTQIKDAKHHIGKHVNVTEIAVTGESHLVKLLSTMYLGDWTAHYLSQWNTKQ